MDTDLTLRETQILKDVIEEYIETAEPVGSKILESKYQLGVSPATIRNEMASLIKKGFLKQPHTSSGRVPTPKALKLYITKLMKPKNLGVSEEVAVKEKVWDARNEFDKLLKEATKALAESTNTLAISTTDNGIFFAGAGNILEAPEFADLSLAHAVFEMLDREDWWMAVYKKNSKEIDPFYVMIGNDWEEENLYRCGFVFVTFKVGDYVKGSIGVLGPSRLNYAYIVPAVEYLGHLITEIAKR